MQSQKKQTPTMAKRPLADSLRATFFQLLPHRVYGFLIYQFCQIRIIWIKNLQISLFVRLFQIDTCNAQYQRPKDFPTLNAFFTRAIVPESRPMPADPALIVSPTDSKIMEFGRIEQGRLIQAKGVNYSLSDLLAADEALCRPFRNGQFINLYLSPQDYHRVHSPIDCVIHQLTHIPGLAYPVSPWSARAIDNLYCRNERAVLFMHTPAGPVALVMIAALGVSSLETTWIGRLSPPHATQNTTFLYSPPFAVPAFNRGEELGRFNLGSSVVLLFGSSTLTFLPNIAPDTKVRLGTPLARIVI